MAAERQLEARLGEWARAERRLLPRSRRPSRRWQRLAWRSRGWLPEVGSTSPLHVDRTAQRHRRAEAPGRPGQRHDRRRRARAGRGGRLRGARRAARARCRRAARRRRRPDRRLLQHRGQHLDRHDLLAAAGVPRRRSRRRVPPARHRPARRRLRRLRPADDAGVDPRLRHGPVHARARDAPVRADPAARPHPAARARVRDQHLQLPPLGCRGAHVRERVHPGEEWPARGGLQHALDGLAGRRSASSRAAASSSIPATAGRGISTAVSGCSTRPIRSPSWSSRRAAAPRRASGASSTSCRTPCTGACRSCSARARRSPTSSASTASRTCRERSPLFGRRGLLRDW